MSLDKQLKKIDAEIQNGLKFKSADRLRNLINLYPNESKLWNALAELSYEGRFLDAAGRYWILTEPTDSRISESVAVYEQSVNYSGYQILREITFRGDKTQLSEYGKIKLEQLEKSSKEKATTFQNFTPYPISPNPIWIQTQDSIGHCLVF